MPDEGPVWPSSPTLARKWGSTTEPSGQNPSLGVILDANVLIPAPLRDTLLRAAAAGLYRVHWSGEILEEARRNLVSRGMATEKQAQRLLDMMKSVFPDAEVSGYEQLVPEMTNDPKDRHVLAAAVAADARIIVTANVRHFPDSALSSHGIEAQTPDAFLLRLLDLMPNLILELIHEQAKDLTSPQ